MKINPERIWSSSQLPTLPSVAIQLLELSKDPETEIKEVIDVIRADPAISAKILKATNSSFFGFKAEVTSIDRAVPLLGTTVVNSLALSFSLVDAAMTSGPLVEHYRNYWMQSIVQAVAAEILSEYGDQGLGCEYFLAGLLMDIGRLAMLKTIGTDYLPVLEEASEQKQCIYSLELEAFGFHHVEIGMQLVKNWNLSDPLIEAIQFHHASPGELKEQLASKSDASNNHQLIKAIAVAAAVGDYVCTANKGPALVRLRELTQDFYGFEEPALEQFLNRVNERVEQAGPLFSAKTDDLLDPSDLMAAANEHLAQLALREHVASTQAVARQQVIEREKQELETKNEQLRNQALRDPLTRVYNRHFFDEALTNEINRCCRSACMVGVVFSDVDHFKQLNDTYGHQFGDLVLQQVAGAFQSVLRKSDVLSRYGGEEFVILVNQPTEKGLEKIAERIRARIEAEPISFEGEPVPVTVSIGASLAIPGRNDLDLGERLIAAADEAMYQSKQNGRNQVHIASLLKEEQRKQLHDIMQGRFSRWLANRRVTDIPTISKALLQYQPSKRLIGQLAIQQGYLTEEQVESSLKEQQETGERFGEIACRHGWIDEDQLVRLLILQQEEPVEFARTLITMGVLSRESAGQLLVEYLAEMKLTTSSKASVLV